MNITLVLGLLLMFGLVPLLCKVLFHRICWKEIVLAWVACFLFFTMIFFIGKHAKTVDYEIWSGSVTSKNRHHDSYIETYQCNCRQSCSGSGQNRSCTQICQTCSRTHYTVTWTAYSNIGSFTIKHLDQTSRLVYLTPDPNRYTIIEKGDPVSKTVAFKNYVKAVPESVFHNREIDPRFASMIPAYPDKVYDFYHIDRVLSVGVPMSDLKEWNKTLSELMCELGPISKANVVLVFVNSADRNYAESLRTSWLNGKKNDAIIVVGVNEYPKIEWVNVFGWSERELFKLELAQALEDEKEVNKERFMEVIKEHIKTKFLRRNMEDFSYLEDSIEPPLWVSILAGFISLLIGMGAIAVKRHAKN